MRRHLTASASALAASVILLAGCSFDTEGEGTGAGSLGPKTTGASTTAAESGSGSVTTEVDPSTSTTTGTTNSVTSSTTASASSEETAEPPPFAFRRRLGFKTAPAGVVEGVVVRVSLDESRMTFANAAPDGSDVAFFSADGTETFPYEVELYDAEAKRAELWVRVGQLGGALDHMWMNYGAAGPVEQPEAGPWDARFEAVYHLSDLSNSTTTNNDAVDVRTANTDGRVHRGRLFSGGAYLDLPGVALGDAQGAVSFWFRSNVVVKSPSVMLFATTLAGSPGFTENDFHLHTGAFGSSGGLHLQLRQTAFGGTGVVSDGQWHLAFAGWTADNVRLFIDDSLIGEMPRTSLNDTIGALVRIGRPDGPAGIHEFNGSIDEVRVLDAPPSDDWRRADFHSQAGVFVEYGVEESL